MGCAKKLSQQPDVELKLRETSQSFPVDLECRRDFVMEKEGEFYVPGV